MKAYKTFEYIKKKMKSNELSIKFVEEENIKLNEMLEEIKEGRE